MTTPAEELLGMTLDGDWQVVEKIAPSPTGTGGFFSVCYIVEKNGTRGFLKAIDLTKAIAQRDPALASRH